MFVRKLDNHFKASNPEKKSLKTSQIDKVDTILPV